MAGVDKNQAVIDYLLTCEDIQNSPLYFNFINAKEDNRQIITLANEKAISAKFINGAVRKRYAFTIIDFKSMATRPIVSDASKPDENVENFVDVQALIDWIDEQEKIHNYPDFGDDCVVELIACTTDNPNLNGIDNSVTPALAKYSITINIEYVDNTDALWQ